MNNNAYYITGPDGSGKTSYIKELEKKFLDQNLKIKHIWLRSPKILSKPLMAYCRIVGLTQYKFIDGVKYGKHEFYKSKFVSWLFPVLQLIDFKLKWYVFKRNIGKSDILLFDRFGIDTLADLMVDTGRMDLHNTWLGRAFVNLVPKNTVIIVMDVEESVIRSRKKDTLHDEHLTAKIKVYKILSRDLNLIEINNNRDFDIVKKELFSILDK